MITFIHGAADNFKGTADLVLTNPYGFLPPQLHKVPMLICNFPQNHHNMEEYCGTKLNPIGEWGGSNKNIIWAGNVEPIKVELSDLLPDTWNGITGWFPLELPLRLLKVYGKPGITVWDGFMGRGTTGKACLQLGMDFIGGDISMSRVKMAKEYLVFNGSG